MIERCVHNYVPHGDIVRYCVKAAFWRGFPYWRSSREASDHNRKRNRTADFVREADRQTEKLAESIDQRSAKLEDAFFSTAEFLDVDITVLSELVDLAKRGISLWDIVSGERYSAAVKDAAKKVRGVF